MKKYKVIRVILKCNGEFVDEKTVTPINIEEGPQGEDILEFKCPKCHKNHKSARYGR